MSHSTCLVIVRDAPDFTTAEREAERLLAPFNEGLEIPHEVFGATDRAVLDECFWWRDSTTLPAEEKANYERDVPPEPDPSDDDGLAWQAWADQIISDYHGGEAIFDGDRIGYLSTYNPRSKWDWYSLGGRWTGFWPLKAAVGADAKLGRPGVLGNVAARLTSDIARKRDIDFDLRIRDKELDAECFYTKVEAILGGLPESDITGFRPWPELRESMPDDIDSARRAYHAQPLVRAFRTSPDRNMHWIDIEDLHLNEGGRVRYVTEARENALSTFAVLDGADWYERGDMGWFGLIADEKPPEDWHEIFQRLLDSVPDDGWLAVYDLHI